MPRFEPFPALRYDLGRVDLGNVIAPPYDVIAPEDAARLAGRSPYNAVGLELAQDEPGRDRYEAARARLDAWTASGVLVEDPRPGFYVYRMGFADDDGRPRQTTGVIGALALDVDGRGEVLPHERTMSRPKDDRLRLLRACSTNLSPIWALSLAPGLSTAAEPAGPPIARCTDDEGVHHRLWRVDAPAVLEAISATVASAPVVIADGHHRYETAMAYRQERRAANGDRPGSYDLVMAYVVELAGDQLGVKPIHRLVAGLPDGFPLLDALSSHFAIEPIAPPFDDMAARVVAEDALAVVTGGRAWLLRPHEGGARTDTELLEAALAGMPPHILGHHHAAHEVVARVEKGDAQAGFVLRPVSVAQIAAAAAARRRLPAKTTFFHPKLRTGLVFRRLEE
jgi:uncharacterized protein (DUF1015 family)